MPPKGSSKLFVGNDQKAVISNGAINNAPVSDMLKQLQTLGCTATFEQVKGAKADYRSQNKVRLTDTPYFTKYPEAAAVIRHGLNKTAKQLNEDLSNKGFVVTLSEVERRREYEASKKRALERTTQALASQASGSSRAENYQEGNLSELHRFLVDEERLVASHLSQGRDYSTIALVVHQLAQSRGITNHSPNPANPAEREYVYSRAHYEHDSKHYMSLKANGVSLGPVPEIDYSHSPTNVAHYVGDRNAHRSLLDAVHAARQSHALPMAAAAHAAGEINYYQMNVSHPDVAPIHQRFLDEINQAARARNVVYSHVTNGPSVNYSEGHSRASTSWIFGQRTIEMLHEHFADQDNPLDDSILAQDIRKAASCHNCACVLDTFYTNHTFGRFTATDVAYIRAKWMEKHQPLGKRKTTPPQSGSSGKRPAF